MSGWTDELALADWIRCLLDSYEHWLGRSLATRRTTPLDELREVEQLSAVVLSHAGGADPVFNYGNHAALAQFELRFEELCQLPSRYSAQPDARERRAQLLERVTRQGYIDDYTGIRISAKGRLFRIHQAVVWNVLRGGNVVGQAATFSEITPL